MNVFLVNLCALPNSISSMSGKNLHSEPFSEETITKLEIFEAYAREWLPTFIMSGVKMVYIFDFFAGTGYDKTGVAGSTIRILTEVKNQIGRVFQKKTKVHICINEYDKKKFTQLKEACETFLAENPELGRAGVELHYYNEDFEALYDKLESYIGKVPSLVYLDQNGVKFTSDKYFLGIAQKHTTDFLYYISSSYITRFGDTPEFRKVLQVDMKEVRKQPYKYVHQTILNYLRHKLPPDSKVKLYPFTIKKHTNVYGIVFGASHVRAVDKFLKTAWAVNDVNGLANFDIDDDASKSQGVLFGEQPLTKIEAFKQNLKRKILSGEIKTNLAAYLYTIEEGHIGTHALDAIKEMKKESLITYDAKSPKVNYESAIQKGEVVTFHILNRQ